MQVTYIINTLKKALQTDNWEAAKQATQQLAQSQEPAALNFLIKLLKSPNPASRNAAALALREIKAQQALEPLLVAIFKPENHQYNGTLVFALQTLDCKDKLLELFQILFQESYEAKLGAYAILEEQIFNFTRADLLKIQGMWDKYLVQLEDGSIVEEEEVVAMVEDACEGFLGYLE